MIFGISPDSLIYSIIVTDSRRCMMQLRELSLKATGKNYGNELLRREKKVARR